MRMGGFSGLARRLSPVTHTDALFAEQSQSILDDLVALLEPQSSTELLSRIRAVCSGHYSILRAHCRTVSWLTMMPRAASNSSTMRSPTGKRKYSHTACPMISAGNRYPE